MPLVVLNVWNYNRNGSFFHKRDWGLMHLSFLSNLINGISLGSVYAIIALGYTMVYGIAKMLNFAHGDVIMIGAYVAFCVTQYLKLPAVAVRAGSHVRLHAAGHDDRTAGVQAPSTARPRWRC